MQGTVLARYIAGYTLGFAIFVVGIPAGLVLIAAASGGIGLGLRELVTARAAVIAPLAFIGLALMAWTNSFMYRIGRGGPTDLFGIALTPRTKRLMVSGPYRLCRHPMVLGAFTYYVAVVALLQSAAAGLALGTFFVLAVVYLRTIEEKRLLRDFGDEYRAYQRHVPMILPLGSFRGAA